MTVMRTAGYFVVTTFLVLSSLLKTSKSNAKNQTSRFSRVITFGDSLSDVENFSKILPKINENKGNMKGRASNGKLWIENIYPNLPRENYAFMSAHSKKSVSTMVIDIKGEPINISVGAIGLGHQYDLFKFGITDLSENSPIMQNAGPKFQEISEKIYNQKNQSKRDRVALERQLKLNDVENSQKIQNASLELNNIERNWNNTQQATIDAALHRIDLPDAARNHLATYNSAKADYNAKMAELALLPRNSPEYRQKSNEKTSSERLLNNAKNLLISELIPNEKNEYSQEKEKVNNIKKDLEKKQSQLILNSPEIIKNTEEMKKLDELQYELINSAISEEISSLKATHAPRSLDPNALYTVWAGMNDMRHLDILKKRGADISEEFALQTARDTVANINNFVKNLISDGAKNIIVANMPTIFLTGDNKEESHRILKFFNNQLHQDLVALSAQNKNINIIPIDMQTLGEELKENPASFGFINATDPCTKGFGKNRIVCSDPENHVFWDELGHLTDKGNQLLGKYVEEILRAPYDIVPQVAATESIAVSATKNVNQRLFALRGASHPLSNSASSLIASSFQNTNSHHDDSMASIMMTSDGNGVSLPEFKKNRFVRRAHAPLENSPKKNYFPSLNSDASTGKFGIFLSGDLHIGNQRNTEETTGYRHTTKTITFGGDYKFTDWFLSGIAMSYIKSDTKLKDNRGNIDIDGYAVSLYDSFKWRKFYLDTVFTYGWNQNKITRNIHTFDRQATGNPLGRHWSVGGIGGYDFHWNGFHFGPTTGIRYGEARIHKYKEDGAGTYNMIVKKQSSSSAVSTLGGHLSYKWKTDIGEITPQIRSSYDHEFKDRSRVVETEFASMRGIPYKVPVQNKDHNYGRIGGGIHWRFQNDISMNFDYETIFARKKARDHFIFGKIRFVF